MSLAPHNGVSQASRDPNRILQYLHRLSTTSGDISRFVSRCASYDSLGRRVIWGRMAMWTAKNRGRYDRSQLRYSSDRTDDEWARVEPMIPPAKDGGNKRRVNVPEVVNGIMYIFEHGCQ
jgi:Putative transposase of IS4/5 family (DUF4096)